MIKYIQNLVQDIEEINKLIALIPTQTTIGLDTETNGLDPFINKVLLLQLKVGEDVYVLNRGQLGLKFCTNLINLINDNDITCLGHNIKFDIKMLRSDTGLWIKNVYDTMVVESVLTSGLTGKRSSLLSLVEKYCGIELEKDTQLEFVELNYETSFTERQITYAARDVLYLFDIYTEQVALAKEAKMEDIVKLESDLVPVVAKMEYEGITLDAEHWDKLTREVEKQYLLSIIKVKDLIFSHIDTSVFCNAYAFSQAVAIPVKTKKLQKALEAIVDPQCAMDWVKENYNLASHKQLPTALRLIGYDVTDTNEKTLNKLEQSDVVDAILEFRHYEKNLTTYGYNIIQAINPVTGRIHADFNQVGTATGRFSSSGGVNMQNIPTEDGYREGFIAKPGYSFIAADYSQQEYRLAGALSKEPAIINAYLAGFDMHTASAANRFGKELKDVTKEERNKGKGINFTVLYGGTEWALGRNLKVPTAEAKKILKKFFEDYPRLAAFKELIENEIVKLGYSITPMGRRRYFKPLPIFATPYEIDSFTSREKREGFNMVIQGGGADVTKIAMINADRYNPFGDKFMLLLQVHDEIVVQAHDSILVEAEAYLKKHMIDAFQPFLGVIPALVDTHISKRWEKK
jgi:DNA polymerase-1